MPASIKMALDGTVTFEDGDTKGVRDHSELELNGRRTSKPWPVKRKSPELEDAGSDPGKPADARESKQRGPPNPRSIRCKSRIGLVEADQGFEPVPRPRKTLWQDGAPDLLHVTATSPLHERRGRAVGGRRVTDQAPESINELSKQPETRPIGQEQLIAEVKGIYAGLVMVENKCIEVDNAQNSLNNQSESPQLNTDQWQALIALHRTLLHEHHDFFLASQHPSASPALRRLASKYDMPARMWRQGIHSFLELLRHRLPHSLEYLLTFIYSSYSMMVLLYETLPAFEYTWIECLGDLSRYRMAMEDENTRDQEVWAAVSRHWYSKASDKAPTTGRLYHNLAILARPSFIAQLSIYWRSLCASVPFNSARDSLITLFEPVMDGTRNKIPPIDSVTAIIHGLLYTNKSYINHHIARITHKWLDPGYQIAFPSTCPVLVYHAQTKPLTEGILKTHNTKAPSEDTSEKGTRDTVDLSARSREVLQFIEGTDDIVMSYLGDLNIMSYLDMKLRFLDAIRSLKASQINLKASFLWRLLPHSLNYLSPRVEEPEKFETQKFPKPAGKPLPEDYTIRGLLWTQSGRPQKYFGVAEVGDDESMSEPILLGEYRCERVVWPAFRIAKERGRITYDRETDHLPLAREYEKPDIFRVWSVLHGALGRMWRNFARNSPALFLVILATLATNLPHVAAFNTHQAKAALSIAGRTITGSSAVSVVVLETNKEDINPLWRILSYSLWCVGFLGCAVLTLRSRQAQHRRAFLGATILLAAHLYGYLGGKDKSIGESLATSGPLALTVSLYLMDVLFDARPDLVQAAIGV